MISLSYLASGDPWDGAIGGIRTVYSSIGNLLMIALGVGAMIVLVMVILQLIQGDRDSAKKFLLWLLTLAVGFTILSILKGIHH